MRLRYLSLTLIPFIFTYFPSLRYHVTVATDKLVNGVAQKLETAYLGFPLPWNADFGMDVEGKYIYEKHVFIIPFLIDYMVYFGIVFLFWRFTKKYLVMMPALAQQISLWVLWAYALASIYMTLVIIIFVDSHFHFWYHEKFNVMKIAIGVSM